MKNDHLWRPTKYVFKRSKLIGSRESTHLSLASRLQADLVASLYQQCIPRYVQGHLIDLGCGNVPLYAVYKPYVDEITCVDWPNSSHMQSHLDFVCDLNSPLPVPDSYFDTIILSDVLEHIAEPKLLWIEMSRILKSGGRALLNVPFYYKIHEAPHDYYRYTEFALRRFADFAKFSIIQLRPIGGAPEVLADLLAKIIYRIPYGGKAFAAFIQFLVHKLGKTTFGQRISTGTAKTFPMGYFMIVEKT